MKPLAQACSRRPFANGTEERAWIGKWCEFCVHDHDCTHDGDGGEGCSILLDYLIHVSEPGWWPEAWLPEPDDGQFFLPSRMICGQFQPCTEGDCNGDPGAEDRAERVAEVTAYWKDRSA